MVGNASSGRRFTDEMLYRCRDRRPRFGHGMRDKTRQWRTACTTQESAAYAIAAFTAT
jgi:hypothetical protein